MTETATMTETASMSETATTDAVATFLAAALVNDVDGMINALSPEAELASPLFGRMVFRGHDDLRALLAAVYGGLSGLRWREVIGEGSTRVAVSDARIAGVTITDAMVLELDDDGRIRRIRPHLKPLLAVTLFAAALGPKLARHPGTIRRALSRA